MLPAREWRKNPMDRILCCKETEMRYSLLHLQRTLISTTLWADLTRNVQPVTEIAQLTYAYRHTGVRNVISFKIWKSWDVNKHQRSEKYKKFDLSKISKDFHFMHLAICCKVGISAEMRPYIYTIIFSLAKDKQVPVSWWISSKMNSPKLVIFLRLG